MPLIQGKSQKSFEKNLKTEMHHGKPLAQSLAIAYAMKRKAQKKAHGGDVYPLEHEHEEHVKREHSDHYLEAEMAKDMEEEDLEEHKHHVAGHSSDNYSHGGSVKHHQANLSSHHSRHGGHLSHLAHGGDVVDRIMKKHHYSKGGMIANQGSAMKSHLAGGKLNEFDDLALRDTLESTQKDYGDHLGDTREEHDRADIVHRIMRSLRKKDRLPSPA